MSTVPLTLSLAQIEPYVDSLPFAPLPTPPEPTAFFGPGGTLVQSEYPNGETTYALFHNCTNNSIDVIWITYDGTEQVFKTLKPGSSFKQTTISNHPWIARNSQDGTLLRINNMKFIYADSAIASAPSQMFVTCCTKTLPSIVVDDQEPFCAICFEEFIVEAAGDIMVVTYCNHCFCFRCLIEVCKYKRKTCFPCPYCRTETKLAALRRLGVTNDATAECYEEKSAPS